MDGLDASKALARMTYSAITSQKDMSVEDKAQEQELLVWQRNNVARTVTRYAPGDPGYGPADCNDCQDDMPEVRRIDGRQRCTPCQSIIERKRR